MRDLEWVLKKDFPWTPNEVSKHRIIVMSLHPFDEDWRSSEKKPIRQIFNDGMQPCVMEVRSLKIFY